MTKAAERGCERCREQDDAVLDQISKEFNEYFGGKAIETRTHYVCRDCSAKWVRTVESGVGGHGRSWTPDD